MLEMFTELGKVGSPPARLRFTGQIRGEQQKNAPGTRKHEERPAKQGGKDEDGF